MTRLVLLLGLLVGELAVIASCATEPANYALAANGGVVSGPRNWSGGAGRPPLVNDGGFDGYAWAYLTTPTVIHFAKPVLINTVDVALYHEQEAWYRFKVEVSSDGTTWTQVADRTQGFPRGFQTVTFAPVECSGVRITFTDTSLEARSYHLLEVGAFMLEDPQQPSPLRLAYQQQVTQAKRTRYEIFLSLLGPQAVLTPEEAARAAQLGPGERILHDFNGDGKPDGADFLDADPKHTVKPLVVRVVDDDGDMGPDGQGDQDSDLYVADWKGDGTADRAVDYWDEDGDGDADRMDIYYPAGAWHGNHVELVVIRDISDDNRMWWTRNYEYDQGSCQWHSDFNGDEAFCMFYWDEAARQFRAFLEAPFVHRDLDGDGVAETTIQFITSHETIQSIRYSYDADNDSEPVANRRDYDFSLNCLGEVRVPQEACTTEVLRNGARTGPYLQWGDAWQVAETGQWKSCSLCWDEIDNNVNPASAYERNHERWEGVGGYPMREGNKRWETDADYSGRMQLYYWPADRRLHLLGAETGYINVDYDHDYKVDAKIAYADEDGDGYFDMWSYDAEADGTPEHVVRPGKGGYELAPVSADPASYAHFVARYQAWLQAALEADDAALEALRSQIGEDHIPPVERWWLEGRPRGYYAADKLLHSREATRYYWDLIREELALRAARG